MYNKPHKQSLWHRFRYSSESFQGSLVSIIIIVFLLGFYFTNTIGYTHPEQITQASDGIDAPDDSLPSSIISPFNANQHSHQAFPPVSTKVPAPTNQPDSTQTTPALKPTQQPSPTPAAKPTQQPSPTPAAKPTQQPSPTPSPKPTQQPSPTPTGDPTDSITPAVCGNAGCNPWGYDFNPGKLIYSPPLQFCKYFKCAAKFWVIRGYVVQCQDNKFSLSGGKDQACSRDGGVFRPLYSH